jgi:hypothetical protein
MAKKSKEREAAVDRLYELPLDEFTAARDELARRLKGQGDGDAGAEVKRLRKPSVAAWALNRVRRGDPGQSDELIEAGRRLREAQEQLIASGDREPLTQASADERRLVGELARQAERELAAADRPVSAAVQEKLRATLHAVATDPEAREGLAAGRLVRDHEATGLGPFAVEQGAAPAGAGPGKRRKEPPARKAAGARERRKQPSPKAAAAFERKARRLEERLERARTRQGELDEESANAGQRLREARRAAARAATELERAEAAEDRTRRRAKEAAKAVLELEGELDELTATRAR